MQLCQLEGSQRPSLRELKIMLLHLMSYRDAVDKASDSFQQKWNQLMPRRLQNRVATSSASSSPVIMSRPLPSAVPNASTPISSGHGRSEIVASVTVHREADRSSLASERGDWQPLSPGPVITKFNTPSSPVNELSLEDELGAVGGKRGVEGFGNDAFADENDSTNQTSSWCELPASDEQGDRNRLHAFVTSTPHKAAPENDDFLVVSRTSASNTSQYETALTSQLSSQGQGQSSSIAALSHNQFSTWLQTVPMSFDGDDGDSLNEASTASDMHRTVGDSFVTVSAADAGHNSAISDHRTDDNAEDNFFM